jgi:hypothetical protein
MYQHLETELIGFISKQGYYFGYCHTPLQHSSLKFSNRDTKVTRHFSSQHVTAVNVFSFFFVYKVCKGGYTRISNSAVCPANLFSGRTWHILVDFFPLSLLVLYHRSLSAFLSRSFPLRLQLDKLERGVRRNQLQPF